MTAPTEYAICDTCAVAVAYGDTSGISGDTLETVEAFIAERYLTPEDEFDPAGYWECECCREITIGTGRVFERI